jgi:hypothetical protein
VQNKEAQKMRKFYELRAYDWETGDLLWNIDHNGNATFDSAPMSYDRANELMKQAYEAERLVCEKQSFDCLTAYAIKEVGCRD